MRCAECRFYEVLAADAGKCHCNPPLAAMHGLGIYPGVQPDNWCGCFDAKADVPEVKAESQAKASQKPAKTAKTAKTAKGKRK